MSKIRVGGKLSRKPHNARNLKLCHSAWWYEHENFIEIFCHKYGADAASFRIDKRAIEGWLKRTKGKR